MDLNFTIIIADKNRHVREFLKREFESAGFIILLAKDEAELMSLMETQIETDLIIYDLEAPTSEGTEILEQLMDFKPFTPIIVHTLLTEYSGHQDVQRAAAFLEKTGANVDDLKRLVEAVLRHFYPARFQDQAIDHLVTWKPPAPVR